MFRRFLLSFLLLHYIHGLSSLEVLDSLESDCFGRKDKDSVFELYSGLLLTAPASLLETLPGIASLESCMQYCKENDGCRALNYETELCVLFSTSAFYETDALSTSEFPVFTIYAQKICVKSGVSLCGARPWAFDTVRDHALTGEGLISKTLELTREACLSKCLGSKACGSLNYNVSSGACELFQEDRSSGVLLERKGSFFSENKCSMRANLPYCKFKSIGDRILKTMDSIIPSVPSVEACEILCGNASFGCQSFDYEEAGPKVCRLSHLSTASLSHLSSPYIDVLGSTSYELSACYDISVDCHDSYMVATVRANRLFRGRIYGKRRPNSCGLDVENKMNFSLRLDYNDIGCDVKEIQPGRFLSEVVLQHHERIVTNSDVSLKVKCNYDLLNRTVNNQEIFNVDGRLGGSAQAEQTIVHSPNVTMRITDRQRRGISSAKVGDHLALTFRIQAHGRDHSRTQYQIFVRELVAIDGLDSSEILLIDKTGCPTDISIMSFVEQVEGSSEVLQANFDAFKFPTSDTVQFRALVTPCIPRCDPVSCDPERSSISYGRRRRKREVSGEEPDVLVGGRIVIRDKFVRNDDGREEEEKLSDPRGIPRSPERCLDAFGAVVGGVSFLFTQVLLVGGILYIYMRRKRYSLSQNDSFLQHTARR